MLIRIEPLLAQIHDDALLLIFRRYDERRERHGRELHLCISVRIQLCDGKRSAKQRIVEQILIMKRAEHVVDANLGRSPSVLRRNDFIHAVAVHVKRGNAHTGFGIGIKRVELP